MRPRVTPVDLENATSEQLEALKVTPSNTKVSDYVLTLAHDVELLKERSPLFNAIMYNRGGLGRTGRELGATAASIVNRCIYCAAVHASRYNQLTKSGEIMAALFEDGGTGQARHLQSGNRRLRLQALQSPLRSHPGRRTKTTRCRPVRRRNPRPHPLDRPLRLANRLMHILGEPVATGAAP